MVKTIFTACLFAVNAAAADIGGMSEAGAVSGYEKTAGGVLINCADGSRAAIELLAPDMAWVRASFRKPLPPAPHSWAVAKTDWTAPQWTLAEQGDEIILATAEMEIVVKRSPFLISFRDAKTHKTINADAKPMLYESTGTAVGAAKKFGQEEHFYGLGEKAFRLDRRRGNFAMWNTDAYGYGEGRDPIYQSVPFYIGLNDGLAYGIFFDNPFKTHFDFGATGQEYAAFSADGGEMNYYFFYGPAMKKVISRYTELTGRIAMPPLWALGNQQCRWSYYPEDVVEHVVDRYRKDRLPLDAVYLDIHYMSDYRVFTWNRQRFPEPKALIERLAAKGVKLITIVDPGVKYQPSDVKFPAFAAPELEPQTTAYYVYEQGAANDYFLKNGDGSPFIGTVWPGKSVFADFTRDDVSQWWGNLHRAYTDNGVAGIWNDMNEPADFDEQAAQKQAQIVYDDRGLRSGHDKNRNVYGLLMSSATYHGLERLKPGLRPFVLTRAGYAGIQRYAAAWTGDNTSSWDMLALSIPMLLNMGLSGEAMIGSDIGGFIQGKPSGELLARWYEVNFLAPLCRNHRNIDGYDQEPWRYGSYYEDIIRKYLNLRYKLMPYLYTALAHARDTGVPVLRALALEYQDDPDSANIEDEFMAGSDLLAAPALAAGRTERLVYLPPGGWTDFWSGKRYSGGGTVKAEAPLETVPLYVRDGSVIPAWPEMNYVGEKPADPVSFSVWPDRNGAASGWYYEDDGLTDGFKKGVFRKTGITVSKTEQGTRIDIKSEGSYSPGPRKWIFRLDQAGPRARQVMLDGNPLAPGAWKHTGKRVSVEIEADGAPHTVMIK
ncbi:MAG: TIM-barrel domain-containing protein [Elusimicrobiales bacterium]